jgi:hypothetical protein
MPSNDSIEFSQPDFEFLPVRIEVGGPTGKGQKLLQYGVGMMSEHR